MFPIDNSTAVPTLPTPSAAGTPGYFTDGNPGGGQAATIVPAEWLNAVQDEILNVLAAASITPNKTVQNQLVSAIAALTPGRLLNTVKFTSSGSWTPTPGATKWHIRGTGGGGGGAASTTSGAGVCSATPYGQSAAAGEFWFTGISGSQAVTIGGGGLAGVTNGAAGGNGGNTVLGSLLTLPGGKGSLAVTPAAAPYVSPGPTTVTAPTVGTGGSTVWSIGTNPAGGGNFAYANNGSVPGNSNSSFGGSAQGYGAGGTGAFTAASGSWAAGATGNAGFLAIEEYA